MPDIQVFPLVLLYFFYGLAFIGLGLSIAVKDMSESRLQLAHSLPSLAIFGLSHGLYEWMICYTLLMGVEEVSLPLHYVRFLTLVLSFLFLNHFAISLLRTQPRIRWQWLRAFIPFLLLVIGMYLWLTEAHVDLAALRRAGMLARLTIGVLGAALASFALFRHGRTMRNLNQPVAANLRRAAICFAVYALVAGIVPSHFIIPLLRVPVEVLRGAAAVGIAFFMVRALNIFNIETRKKLEQQLRQLTQTEKLAALGKLAAGIAHEINNPLTNVSLQLELLRQDTRNAALPDGAKKRFDVIERNLARASNIASELLGFARQGGANLQPVDLNGLVQGTLTLLGSRRKEYNLITELQPLPPVLADGCKVEEVFLNVLINAMEASEPGGAIEVRSRSDGTEVLVEVIDHGSGIAPEELPRVLEPFYTTKEVGKGTGLGLSICYNIMEMHNGGIELKATAGGGTTVVLTFPVAAEGAA
ncbi:MAG: ATP-binding protein [Thermodesulfobacteriota bacterium]